MRLIARIGLAYPGDAASLALVRAAGGFSKLTDEDRARVVITRVAAGEACDDVPEESRPGLLESGAIEILSDPATPAIAPAAEGRSPS